MDYDWAHSALRQRLESGKRLMLPKGQVVNAFDDNANLNFLVKGYIKRYLITADGSKGIQVIYGPGDIFPLTPVYKNVFQMAIYSGPEQYYYESMTDIEVCSVSQSELKQALEENPAMYKDLFYAAGLRLNSYIHRLESMSRRSANRKVAHQIAYLASIFGKQEEDGSTTITVPMTHQNLADVLNLARETVTLCLKRLEEKGIIKADKLFTVLDAAKLRHEVH